MAAAITSTTATTITVAAAAPAVLQGGQFRIVIDSEIMLVTAGASGTSWTVTRGNNLASPDTCTATTHSSGANVYHDPTAAALQNLVNQAAFLPTAGGTMSGAIAMGSNKITGLTNGTASSDAAAFGQVPTAGSSTPNMDGTGSAGSATTWSKSDHVHPTDTSRAPVASPTLTGTPVAPTAAADTNTTQLATTAFVLGQTSSSTPAMDGSGSAGTSTRYARSDHVHPTDTSRAPLASPTFTGITTAPEFSASGLTGATAASRYVGATTSGAPASGTFALGDFVIDQSGAVWVCTTAGSPGTWTKVGGSGSGPAWGIGTAASRPSASTFGSGIYFATDSGEVTFSNGTSWYQIGAIQVSTSGTLQVGANNFGGIRLGDTGTMLFGEVIGSKVKFTGGNFDIGTTGNGLQVAEGTNAKQGTATLVAGTVTVSNTSVTATSRIFLTTQTPGGTVGSPYVSARTAGTSFTITSTSATDTSTVAYEIFEVG